MIVHKVAVGMKTDTSTEPGEHKNIYVGCAECDIRYRDMLVNARQRWGFYTRNTFDFTTGDRNGAETERWRRIVEKRIRESDGVMILVSGQTASDGAALWEIDCALSNAVPVVGVDVRKNPASRIPEKLIGKMTRFGWEWIADYIDGLGSPK